MSCFKDDMNDDLFDVFMNPDDFGEDSESDGVNVGIRYMPANGAPSRIIRAIYDEPSSAASTEATHDVTDNRPHLTIRSCDLEGEKLNSGDRFVRNGIELKPVDYPGSNGQGVCRCFLQEI